MKWVLLLFSFLSDRLTGEVVMMRLRDEVGFVVV